mmetsp:Transcript_26629/g.58352  ORF Transcript_26629/g.58352 Transcript_26629/m.58352 type:complete len:175 (-) Transcript_26629:200-724(-)|eukprot:CAMPEP_0178488814 /NCGR_PEP_ID=MMETSP0696-20121128/10054_1 /TAXON_ID=265572 /ORGANISM="Extubocellulus spinifer, Strain CCMP396" /LENGTH=174 /DNA_ID=CAMNT_0020116595 /DNA_START=244 /DNA_END=768 /DNA_ORIENTATION=-
MTRDDKLARQMFYGGCALLPWLWIVNVCYFRKLVYGPIPLLDYWPGGGRRQAAVDAFADGTAYAHDGEEEGPIQNMPAVGGGRDDDDDTDDDDDDETEFDDENNGGASRDEDEALLHAQMVQKEVEKWVKRSSLSAFLVVGLFLTWVVLFQVYKDEFGPQWFVMSEDPGEATGW